MLTHMADLFLPARLSTALSKQNANRPPPGSWVCNCLRKLAESPIWRIHHKRLDMRSKVGRTKRQQRMKPKATCPGRDKSIIRTPQPGQRPSARLRARRAMRSRHADLMKAVAVGLLPAAMVMPEPPMMVMPVPPLHLLDGSVLRHSGTDDIPAEWSSGCH
jgi:hypothetical protein